MTIPLVAVVEHRREDRSGWYELAPGQSVHLCGLYVSIDRLACGHTVEVPGGKAAKRRRCAECQPAAPTLM